MVSTGGEGLLVLAQNEYKVLTYRSLQPYQDFQQRGASKLRNYFYREYSLMLWDAIHRYNTHHHSFMTTEILFIRLSEESRERTWSSGLKYGYVEMHIVKISYFTLLPLPSFVSGMVSLYYHYDSDVVEDTELQAWIKDIADEGFVDVPRFGQSSTTTPTSSDSGLSQSG